MPEPVVLYMQLSHEAYKSFEQQCKDFNETVHTTVTGFYHKSIRLRIGEGLIVEYHGPIVKTSEPLKPGEWTASGPGEIDIDKMVRTYWNPDNV